MSYIGQQIQKILPGNVAVGGANMGMVPLFSVQWCPSRSAIWAGYVAADGQEIDKNLFPDADAGIQAGNVPVVAEATWQSTPTERGKFVATSSAGKFRLPDYNGKSVGSLGALFLRGDGSLSAAVNGAIQQDEIRSHTHGLPVGSGGFESLTFKMAPDTQGNDLSGGQQSSAFGGNETRPLNVTGCWVINLFGAVTNTGSADAAQLATDYANLVARVTSVEATSDKITAPGEAPIFGCRAWVVFDGTTSPPTVSGSGNIASVTKSSTGVYVVSFEIPMGSNGYSVALSGHATKESAGAGRVLEPYLLTPNGFNIASATSAAGSLVDSAIVCASVFW